jgi:hypothetical protein
VSNNFNQNSAIIKNLTFIAPSGVETLNPNPEIISACLMAAGPAYWESGSGDAALRLLIRSKVIAELIILVRDGFGVFVQFIDVNTSQEFVLFDSNAVDEQIVIQHAGDPWELPRRFFVKRELADQAVRWFIAHGERSARLPWELF